ncbi:MAG: YeaH/YhbH family protein [Thiotrichales bacterium]
MSQIIDRRSSGKNKSAVNRQRFLKRFKKQIRKAVDEAISGRTIDDIEKGEEITIPSRDLKEPIFHQGKGGFRKQVHPGNREFTTGDRIERPPQEEGGGQGSSASDQGEGMDDFAFELSREEFLNFFFEGLALPDLVKKQLGTVKNVKKVRAGYATEGNPSNLSVVRSFRSAIGRRLAMSAGPREKLKEALASLEALEAEGGGSTPEAAELREEIARLEARIKAVPFIDTFDLRYTNRVDQPQPITQAVMFCLMDVSGSMDQHRKDIAKRFFMLLHLFLTRNYERIEVVFIRHHTVAREVDEQEFFYSRETGGTVVSSALNLMVEIATERYPTHDWNIYVAQASDGDNFISDSPRCSEIIRNQILPLVQHYSYVEIAASEPQSLWFEYEAIAGSTARFDMERIDGPEDIYPVFRELFKSKTT